MPTDWERRHWDLRPFITRVNRLKLAHPLLQGEGHLRVVGDVHGDTLVLRRTTDDGSMRGWIVINKVWAEAREMDFTRFVDDADRYRLMRVCRDDADEDGEPVPRTLMLHPAEVVYVLPALEDAADA
jgi:hypothetical protein